jgi:RNA polymerase sigma-B factor
MDTFAIYRADIAKAQRYEPKSLVTDNLPLVVFLAKRFWRTHPEIDIEELIGVGNVGLLKAADGYDPERPGQEKFSTYASAIIFREFLQALIDHWYRGVRVPRKTYEQVRRIQLFVDRRHRLPNIREASRLLGRQVPLDRIRFGEILRAFGAFQRYDTLPADMLPSS